MYVDPVDIFFAHEIVCTLHLYAFVCRFFRAYM